MGAPGTAGTACRCNCKEREAGLAGCGQLSDDMVFDGTEVVYFHGTDVSRGLEIMKCGAMEAPIKHRPVGVYTAKNESAISHYDFGCIVEVISAGRILSVRETASLGDRPVPKGFVGCLKRSVQEFIHHPKTIHIIAMTFDLETLVDAVQFMAPTATATHQANQM